MERATEVLDGGDRLLSTAVLPGVIVGGLATIVEYNLTGASGTEHSVGAGLLLGGVIAGFLADGARRKGLMAGGCTGGVLLAVLTPLAIFDYVLERSVGTLTEPGIFWVGVVALVYPSAVVFGFILGALGGFVGQVLAAGFEAVTR
ncbi:DUF5518 domain-containing protein [Natronolimnohabitans sp. A-GB9]|uniref:DUF5518 domain-containing protein n=1 Tax=Natronolimnohabitans sp. A-GB9 TaxID=3069757 RepID=UPI0027B2E367|nr:DUF5518 domain-containing protein [Natronolimnohabitans sp. A-GB9]MDQ2050317.1 DUF5518 domain-containing protein [Natronolimnohabitans sp. A-GB9]